MYNHLYAYELFVQERHARMDRVLGHAPTTLRPLPRRRRYSDKRRRERA